MDKVSDADTVAISVTAGDDSLYFSIGQVSSGRYRDRASMQTVDAVSLYKPGQVRRAANRIDRFLLRRILRR